MTRLRRSVFAVLTLCLLAPVTQAQSASPTDSAKITVARRILLVTNAAELTVQTMTAALTAQRQASPQVPGALFDSLLARAKSQTGVLIERLIPSFTEVYTLEELRELLAFYESPIGRRMIELQPVVMAKTMEIGQNWGMEIGNSVTQEFIRSGRLNPDMR
jgi:hypothetical protein